MLPMMPADARRGRRWSDHRMVVNGIMFRTRTGCPWRDLPGEYGKRKTAYNRHRRWSLDGTWQGGNPLEAWTLPVSGFL